MSKGMSRFSPLALRAAREAKGLTIRMAARKCRVHASEFSRYESGQRKPTIPTVKTLLTGLETTVDVLIPIPDHEMLLHELRENRLLERVDAAKLAGMTQDALYDVEDGQRRPRDNETALLASVYKVPEQYVLECWERTADR